MSMRSKIQQILDSDLVRGKQAKNDPIGKAIGVCLLGKSLKTGAIFVFECFIYLVSITILFTY